MGQNKKEHIIKSPVSFNFLSHFLLFGDAEGQFKY